MEKSESTPNQSFHSLRMMQSKRPFIFHLWRLRRNGHSRFITGAWLWINLCLFLKTESRYKNKLTTESCFHLHKILDSVVLIHPLNIINTNSPCYPKVSSSFSLFVFLIPAWTSGRSSWFVARLARLALSSAQPLKPRIFSDIVLAKGIICEHAVSR